MPRRSIPLGECGLLSRANARRYCGGLGEDRFDREVGPHVTPRMLGGERFYARKELDAWIDRPGSNRQAPVNWLERLDHDLDSRPRR
ncbi:MAG: hypothetical protein JNL61_11410 [Rhizobiaceae bacterium]|nr:hypothetical protein [Rhizobiaceae bacterium]